MFACAFYNIVYGGTYYVCILCWFNATSLQHRIYISHNIPVTLTIDLCIIWICAEQLKNIVTIEKVYVTYIVLIIKPCRGLRETTIWNMNFICTLVHLACFHTVIKNLFEKLRYLYVKVGIGPLKLK